MDKNEALSFIHGCLKFGSVLGLESISRLLKYLDNPHKGLKYIHVAGTNGKGSVSVSLANILSTAGYKTGLYTSPAIHDFNERIRIDGKEILDEELTLLTERVKASCEKIVADGFLHPTEFEVVTAIAFLYYKEKACDYVVLEVGLGGRLDATNIIEKPLLAIITSISYDHQDRLGKTIREIASEKCGIIKKGTKVITPYAQNSEALEVIKEKAETLKVASKPEVKEESLSGTRFLLDNEEYFVSLSGSHQAENVSLSITASKILGIRESDIKRGLESVYHEARMELLSKKPVLLVDGAHNESAFCFLKKNLEKLLPNDNKTLIIGMLKDKDYEKCASIIAPLFERVITVDVKSDRNYPKEKLKEVFEKFCPLVSSMSLTEAIKEIKGEGSFVVAGSLYMASEFKALYRKEHLLEYKGQGRNS